MPIINIHFEEGVFYCKEVGEITPDDATRWANYAERFAEESPYPIVALIDATECTFVTAKARAIFARASAMPNLAHAAVAVTDFKVKQSVHLIAMMALQKHTQVFDTIEAAAQFAYQQAQFYRGNQANV